jgi:hypothetical protein
LRGEGPDTILLLADHANCPVIVLGAPMDKARGRHGIGLYDVLVDGNRAHQEREDWLSVPDGSWLLNNGVVVWHVEGADIERVICCRGRSGGLVSTAQTLKMTVRDYTAYDNQFDGLACYLTRDSYFGHLDLHDNLAAGISIDLDFVHNVIDGAVLTSNDLGVFMRQSRDNSFNGLVINRCRHDGIFMAQAGDWTQLGWRLFPGTECTGNVFNDLRVEGCGGSAFRVNNASCTNNSVNAGAFLGNARGGLLQPVTLPVVAHALTGQGIQPALP